MIFSLFSFYRKREVIVTMSLLVSQLKCNRN